MSIRTIASQIRQQWFAPSCVLCDAVSDDRISLCTGCQQDLPWLLHCCNQCGIPLENPQRQTCLQCELNPPAVDAVICALHYASPVDFLVKRMKFGHQLAFAKVLGELLARHLSQQSFEMPDVMLPVPLHKSRLRTRGFNQAMELCRELRTHYDLPLLKGVNRVKNTQAQTTVERDERASNLQGAFALEAGASAPRHVVIVDDVITTGATTNTLAAVLKQAGVQQVSVWAVAVRRRKGAPPMSHQMKLKCDGNAP